MKITYFIGSTIGGGAEHVMCDLASYMCKQEGVESEILTATRTKNSYLIHSDVNVVSLENSRRIKNRYIRLFVKMINLYKYIETSQTELYVVFLPETIKAIMFFRRMIKVPILVSERSNPASYEKKLKKEMIKAFAKADAIVFQTEEARNFYQEMIEKMPNSLVIPNAITGELPSPYDGKREKILVSAGRIKKEKNFDLLIQAFSRVSNVFPEYKLYIYGEGELKNNYIDLTKKLGIEDKVVFPGYVSNLAVAIKKATAFVLSSDYEGMPNALIEAMAMGIPCVSTDCSGGGASFLINNMENGILVSRGSIDELTKGIMTILENPKLQEKLSVNSKEIRSKLSQNNIYSQWREFFINTIDRQ
jgi:glycosyltransferase involved in cell wall biosynthesis